MSLKPATYIFINNILQIRPLTFELSMDVDKILPELIFTTPRSDFYFKNGFYTYKVGNKEYKFNIGDKVTLHYTHDYISDSYLINNFTVDSVEVLENEVKITCYAYRELMKPTKKFKKTWNIKKIKDILQETMKGCDLNLSDYKFDIWDEDLEAFHIVEEYYTPYRVMEVFKDLLQNNVYAYVQLDGTIHMGFKYNFVAGSTKTYKYAYPYVDGYNPVIAHNLVFDNNDKNKIRIKLVHVNKEDKKILAQYPGDFRLDEEFTDLRIINIPEPINESLARIIVENAWKSIPNQLSGTITTFGYPFPKLADIVEFKYNIFNSFSTQAIGILSEFETKNFFIKAFKTTFSNGGLRNIIELEQWN